MIAYQTIRATQKLVNVFGWDKEKARECIHQIAEAEDVLVVFATEDHWREKIHAANWYGCKWLFCSDHKSPIARIDILIKDFQYIPIPIPPLHNPHPKENTYWGELGDTGDMW